MEFLKKNWLVAVMVVFCIVNVGVYVIGNVVVEKAADRVIEKLQKEYSPSPYGPGLDPDKLSPANAKKYFQIRHPGSTTMSEKTSRDDGEIGKVAEVNWRADWEQQRGFIPEQ